MRYLLLIFSFIFMCDVSAKGGDPFEIKIGNAVLKGVIPGKRTKRAPDLAVVQKFDICGWLKDENNQKHNASERLLRKLWEFKKIFKAPHGSLIFSVSIVNNQKYGKSLNSYYEGVANATILKLKSYKDKGHIGHNYGPAEDYEEFLLDGHRWMNYHADYKSARYYRTYINDHMILRLNLIQSDDRKNAVKGEWHPEAEKLAKQILDSIELTLPEDGGLCICEN